MPKGAPSATKVLGVIPARGGSKGIANKNLVPVGGRPLLHWALTAALGARGLDRLVVSSDSEPILAFAGRYGSALPLVRPSELAQDASTSISVLQHALDACERGGTEIQYDLVILIQCTNPFVLSQDIDAVISKMLATGCDACFTVTRANHLHPAKLKRLEGDRLLPYAAAETDMVRRQDTPDVYIRTGSLYGVTRDLVRRGTFFGEDSRAIVVPASRSIDINDQEDLTIADAVMTARQASRGEHR